MIYLSQLRGFEMQLNITMSKICTIAAVMLWVIGCFMMDDFILILSVLCIGLSNHFHIKSIDHQFYVKNLKKGEKWNKN